MIVDEDVDKDCEDTVDEELTETVVRAIIEVVVVAANKLEGVVNVLLWLELDEAVDLASEELDVDLATEELDVIVVDVELLCGLTSVSVVEVDDPEVLIILEGVEVRVVGLFEGCTAGVDDDDDDDEPVL